MKQFYTDEELIRMVDNKPDATELERELAERLNKTLTEVIRINKRGKRET